MFWYNLGVELALQQYNLKFGASTQISEDEAYKLGIQIGINWKTAKFSPADFAKGVMVEFEHGAHDPETNVTNDDLVLTGKIAWAHLKEDPEYYQKLARMESS